MANPRRGEIDAHFDGKPYTLCLTLGALAELEHAFGDADMLNNNLLDQGGNRDLFINAINWLAEDQEILGERPSREQQFVTTFTLPDADGRWLLTMSTVVIPGLFLLTGISVFLWRRQHG